MPECELFIMIRSPCYVRVLLYVLYERELSGYIECFELSPQARNFRSSGPPRMRIRKERGPSRQGKH